MKIFTLSILLSMLFCFASTAQTATNFVVDDCSGTTHDLFSTLDEGKVVVICWVMPCASCTGPALTSYNVVTYYQSEYPGKVLYYLVDDYANTSCASLDGWASSKSIPANSYSFRFVNSAIKMSHYGEAGMPKTIVVGGPARQVFFNENYTLDSDALVNAIDDALASVGVADVGAPGKKALVYPNPANDLLTVELFSAKTEIATMQLIDVTGKVVHETICNLAAGENKISLHISNTSNGTYFLKQKEAGRILSSVIINR